MDDSQLALFSHPGKLCGACHQFLPLDQFHRRADGHGDGRFTSCRSCENARHRNKYWRYLDKNRKRGRDKNRRLKLEVLGHYGRFCACCGEDQEVFLAIDHIDGGGTRHRQEVKKGSGSFYSWLKKNGWPAGFQTLCHNCNWAKHHGGCPHNIPLPELRIIDKETL